MLEEVTVGGDVVVKLNLQCYHAVVNLLEWTPPQNRRQWREEKKAEEIEESMLSLWLAHVLVLRSRLLFLPPSYMLIRCHDVSI